MLKIKLKTFRFITLKKGKIDVLYAASRIHLVSTVHAVSTKELILRIFSIE